MPLPEAVRVAAVVVHHATARSLVLDCHRPAEPGQFVMAWVPGVDERPMSLVDDTPWTLLTTGQGPFSAALAELRPGDRVRLRGPFGRGYQPVDGPLVLAGRGHGVGPLAWLARRRAAASQLSTAFVSIATPADAFLGEQFSGVASVEVIPDAGGGIPVLTERVASRVMADAAWLCTGGSERLTAPLLRAVAGLGPGIQVAVDRLMKCGGMALCGACELDGVLLCREGPVLDGHHALRLPDFGARSRDAAARFQRF